MAKISGFVYCLNAERMQDQNGGEMVNANGIVSALTPDFIPGMYSFSIVFSLVDINIFANNSIRVIFKMDNSGDILADSGVVSLPPAVKKEDEEGFPPNYQSLNMTMDFRNVVLKEDGLYTTIIYFNEEQVGSQQDIYVKGKKGLTP